MFITDAAENGLIPVEVTASGQLGRYLAQGPLPGLRLPAQRLRQDDHLRAKLHGNETRGNELQFRLVKIGRPDTPGLRDVPGGRGLSVLLTRLYAPSGDCAGPAYAA
jgi:hypothetical protein